MVTIQDLYNYFILIYIKHSSIVAGSTVLSQGNLQYNGCSFTIEMYNAIVENSFMKIYLAWEQFLEKTFIAYLQNATDMKGLTYTRYGIPLNDQHAYDMLRGTKNYPDWTKLEDINRLSKIYFDNSGPYAILTSSSVELLEMKTIRNRISHVSENSLKQFNSLLAKNISQINIEPGDYLMTLKDGANTYFTFYVDMLKDYVEAICNT